MTLAAAIGREDWHKVWFHIPAQMLGAFLGAAIVSLHYLPHWAATESQVLKLACFCTGPAIRDAHRNWISEIIATFVLIFVSNAHEAA